MPDERSGEISRGEKHPPNNTMDNKYYVYILGNENRNVLYVGVTNNIARRLYEHKEGLHDGFTKKYNVNILLYAETYTDIKAALFREKQIKHWSRKKKEYLINSVKPTWEELPVH